MEESQPVSDQESWKILETLVGEEDVRVREAVNGYAERLQKTIGLTKKQREIVRNGLWHFFREGLTYASKAFEKPEEGEEWKA